MDFSQVVYWGGNVVYTALAAVAVWGVFCIVLLWRRINKKLFRTRETEALFFSKLRDLLRSQDYDGALRLCNSPGYWNRAVCQLAAVAIENRHLGLSKVRQLMVDRFDREVLSDLEHRMSWVSAVIKSAPMLGLHGTVLGMIGAFAKIASASRTGVDPSTLAGEISLALYTTAIGLTIAIPLVLCAAFINVRIRRLQDAVDEGSAQFLEEFAEATAGAETGRRAAQYAQPRS